MVEDRQLPQISNQLHWQIETLIASALAVMEADRRTLQTRNERRRERQATPPQLQFAPVRLRAELDLDEFQSKPTPADD